SRDHCSGTIHAAHSHGGVAMAAPSAQPMDSKPWPCSMPLAEWQATRDTLHMWMQMVGKTRLALAPRQNHWWHVALYVTARGLTSSPIPVHFFWGAFDLALARFNGRRASHKDTDSRVLREANSHEEISVGFWPGSGTVTEPAFYAYARPEPDGLAATSVRPAAARYDPALADFILTYEAARSASGPDDAVLEFYQSVYDAAADLARWDRAALDRPPAEWSE